MTEPMPVFVIKAKDSLGVEAVREYQALCRSRGLFAQAEEVGKAIAEFVAWRAANPDRVKAPSHQHVPAGDQVDAQLLAMRLADAEDAHARDREEWETTKQALAGNAAALQAAETELGDFRALFDLQWKRTGEATARWRAEAPDERAMIMPDLGRLLSWLLEQIDTLTAARERDQRLITRVGEWVDQCEVCKANHDALIAAYHDYESETRS